MGIGALLLKRGLLSQGQLDQALAEQRSTGQRLDRVLIRLGHVSREQVLHAVGEQFHMPVIDLDTVLVEPKVLQALPPKLIYKQNCVPIAKKDNRLTIATSDPFELTVLDELRMLTGCGIDLVLADEADLQRFIRTHYGVAGDTLDGLAGSTDAAPERAAADNDEAQAQEASVVRLVNDILAEAIRDRATDVHLEPYENELAVRYRIDGVLQRANLPPTVHRFAPAIISRLKIMANLNIAEKRRPQDGRITFRLRDAGGRGGGILEYDLRASVIPMAFGEGVVLRVLSKSAVLMGLDQLGMPEAIGARWQRLIDRPHGIVLVTGPTGSGKSTTLYASLARIVTDEIKAITIEDPVEYHVPGVNQIQVNPKIDLTFAAGLRAVLRHDPDAIMIGEIRDRETAETAIQASLTGHMVLSTLHTNDAAGAPTRLLDMGVEPFLVASALEGVMAQRLVRRVCEKCAAPHAPDEAELPPDLAEALRGAALVRGAGCKECRQTGYRGRIGIYELLTMSDASRELIMRRAPSPTLAAAARAAGELSTLREDGIDKARRGVTTVDEVVRGLSA